VCEVLLKIGGCKAHVYKNSFGTYCIPSRVSPWVQQLKSASAELKRVLDREQMILVKQWYFRNQLNRGLGHFFSHQLVREYLGDDLPKGPEFTIALQKAAQAELAATTKAYREIFVKFVRQLDDHGRKQLGKLIDLPKI
jgi:hypothetical protein